MRALAWHGKHDVRIDNVPDPGIVNPRDCVIKAMRQQGIDARVGEMMRRDVPVVHCRQALPAAIRELEGGRPPPSA